MNYKEIETLKYILTNMAMKGARIKNEDFKVEGKVIGVGFKPYWSNPYDTKMEKLELNIMDNYGRVLPFSFYHVLGYEVVSSDNRDPASSDNLCLEIHVFTPANKREKEKVRIDFCCSSEKN